MRRVSETCILNILTSFWDPVPLLGRGWVRYYFVPFCGQKREEAAGAGASRVADIIRSSFWVIESEASNSYFQAYFHWLRSNVFLCWSWEHVIFFSSRYLSRYVVVVNLASRSPQFLGSASSAPEGLGSQYGANLVRTLPKIRDYILWNRIDLGHFAPFCLISST